MPYRKPLSNGCRWVKRSHSGRSGKFCLLHLKIMGSSYKRPAVREEAEIHTHTHDKKIYIW